jgi:hypothetical protein
MPRKRFGIALALLLVVASGWFFLDARRASARLEELDAASFEQFKHDFNAAAGSVRVIALLSPT